MKCMIIIIAVVESVHFVNVCAHLGNTSIF